MHYAKNLFKDERRRSIQLRKVVNNEWHGGGGGVKKNVPTNIYHKNSLPSLTKYQTINVLTNQTSSLTTQN